jgi:hypothetical protein
MKNSLHGLHENIMAPMTLEMPTYNETLDGKFTGLCHQKHKTPELLPTDSR